MQEFELLADFLQFDKSLASLQQVPSAIGDLQASLITLNSILPVSVVDMIRSVSGLDMQVDVMMEDFANGNTVLQMPANLYLLTPYFSFSFIELPGDYQRLVKEYYNRKCRFCKTQVQKNAICLLCGEVLCLMQKDDCCSKQPGQLTFESHQSFF